MARLARCDVFNPMEVSVFHCINRCVRRCFLCGDDPVTGHNYDYRKAWLEGRLKFLAGQFGIDVLGFAILSNHFHLVLRNRPDVVAAWSDTEVATRWLRLCPRRKTLDGEPAEPTVAELDTVRGVPEKLAQVRRRLSDISWLMRMIAEPIARQANREDRVAGRFWQGRFRAVRLCDEAAVLACLAYVDLNLVRAALSETPEASDFTSIQRRIESLDLPDNSPCRPDAWLALLPLAEANAAPASLPCVPGLRASNQGFLPLSLEDYLELLDWTGRQMVQGRGAIAADLAPILERVGIAPTNWLPLVTGFGRLFHRVAGAPRTLECSAALRRFRAGRAALLGAK